MIIRYLFVFILSFPMIYCTHTKWHATYHTSHPLVGKILNRHTGNLIEFSKFSIDIVNLNPDLMLLGEAHDHPDHHILHLKILESLQKSKLLGTLFLEHLNLGQNKTLLDIFSDPDPFIGLEDKLNWSKGWDEFRYYQPMIKLARKANQNTMGVNASRADLKAIAQDEEVEALSHEDIHRIKKINSISKALEDALAEEIVRSHCNMFPKKHAGPIVKAQVLRDKIMSHTILSSLVPGKTSVFVGGNGHMRKDRGVPYYLSSLKPSLKLVSIGFIQVDPEKPDKNFYIDHPFDMIFFTPVFDISDPCEKFRKSLEKMRRSAI